MLCDKCKEREASILVEQNLNGYVEKMHLCPSCASNINMPLSFGGVFQDILSLIEPFNSEREYDFGDETKCSKCSLTYSEFKKTGKFGCDCCYTAFDKEIANIFGNIQSNVIHNGKIPKKLGGDYIRVVREYREELKKAIENEEYEKAADLRDKIKAAETEISLKEGGGN